LGTFYERSSHFSSFSRNSAQSFRKTSFSQNAGGFSINSNRPRCDRNLDHILFEKTVTTRRFLLALILATPVLAENHRQAWKLDESYDGPHQEAFQKLRFYIPGLVSTAQLEMASQMGLDYRDGFHYPLTIGFVEEPAMGSEYELAYVRLSADDSGISQRLNINLDAYSRLDFNFDKVFYHEMSHIVLSDAVGAEAFTKLPVWLVEGLAVWVADQGEQLTRAEAHRYPGYADRILILDLNSPRQGNAYPQYFMAIQYIVESKGVTALQNFVHDLVQTRPLKEAMMYNLGEDWPTFQKKVREFSIRYIKNMGTGDLFQKENPY